MKSLAFQTSAEVAAAIPRVVTHLQGGGLLAYPTETVYGLGSRALHADVAALAALKGRSAGKAVPLIAADHAQVVARFGALAPVADRLARAFWPGPLSLILPATLELAVDVHGGAGTVAVRVPNHAVAQLLARLFDYPLTATSANFSGRMATSHPDDVEAALGDLVAVLVDAGPASGGPPSTIADVTGPAVRLVRAGAVAWDRVLRCLDEP